MLELVLQGVERKEIAKRFKMDKRTVQRDLAALDKEGLLKAAEEEILNDIYPLALQVMKKHLREQLDKKERPSIDGAKSVLKDAFKRVATKEPAAPEDLTLEAYLLQRRAKGAIDAQVSGPSGSPDRVLNPAPEDERRADQSLDADQREEDRSLRDGREVSESEVGTDS